MITCFVGIDIAAESVTAAWHGPTPMTVPLTVPQTKLGFRTLVKALRQHAKPSQTQIVMEATSTYWMALAAYLHQRHFIVSVINPLQARHFAQAQLQRTKTDQVDARMLSDYARRMEPDRWSPPPLIWEQLQQRLAQRDDLVHMRTQEHNRRHALTRRPQPEASVVDRLTRHIAYLNQEIASLETEIEALLSGTHAWADSARRLTSITGIGLLTAAMILVATQNFAYCQTPEQAVAFAGLAPRLHQSGSSVRGQRGTGRGGHAALRRALYMAAGAALQHNPPVRAVYLRLVARGKLKNVARVAAARKLLILAWTLVVKQRTFDPDYALRSLAA